MEIVLIFVFTSILHPEITFSQLAKKVPFWHMLYLCMLGGGAAVIGFYYAELPKTNVILA